MLASLLFAVVEVEEKNVPTALFLLWGAVIDGGVISMILVSAGTNSYNPQLHNAGRLLGRIALFALIPAVTLSCSALTQ